MKFLDGAAAGVVLRARYWVRRMRVSFLVSVCNGLILTSCVHSCRLMRDIDPCKDLRETLGNR